MSEQGQMPVNSSFEHPRSRGSWSYTGELERTSIRPREARYQINDYGKSALNRDTVFSSIILRRVPQQKLPAKENNNNDKKMTVYIQKHHMNNNLITNNNNNE